MDIQKREHITGLFPMCADILHAGHILALQEAKKHCDCLIVALNTHPDGKKPVQTVFERYTQLCAVEWVDKVIPYQGKTDLEIIASVLNYQVRFLGDDYRDGEWDGKQQEAERGIEPHFISRAHNLSSTDVKNRVILQNEESIQGFVDVVELAKDYNLPLTDEMLKRYEHIMRRRSEENTLTIVRVSFGKNTEKTYDYKYIGDEPVSVGDRVIVETVYQGRRAVEVVDVFKIKESEAEFDYAIAEKESEQG